MEFVLGGVAACGAGVFTNPLEVVKTRMQLQGELKARGQYAKHYRNVFHAFFAIAKNDGILALQKGLVPALWYQLFMNGWRLGAYQCFDNFGFTKDKSGTVSIPKSIVAGATAGGIGAVVGSPVYMIKTHLQSRASQQIAVGHQHDYSSMSKGIMVIYRQQGVKGLWRGVSGAVPRVMVGSAVQLTTFSRTKQLVADTKLVSEDSWLVPFTASMMSGVFVVACMTPFDVVSTRLYNQGTDARGKGLTYKGFFDCFVKVFMKEGIWGFYKGWAASLFRLGPHTVLSLSIWTETRKNYKKLSEHTHFPEVLKLKK
ncbi:unnamed protein product [Owenia fusiformis]|uniref:Uncharacterized protein n=1 Tax=Owenia fusiformis TaxID=6347 RepID=A0A8J1U9B7_OWEFU|nr:unnamed protein product [Owenia fusiformis]